MAKLGSVSVELEADATSLNKTLREVNGKLGKLSKDNKKTGASFGAMAGKAGIAAAALIAVSAAARLIVGSLRKFAELESKLATVGAVSNATAVEMKKITSAAEELGATTSFTAAEAAEGMTFLAMAGLDARKSIAAMPAVLQLATAGVVDLGTAADVVTNIMAGFGKGAEELSSVNDTLVATFTGSNVTLSELGEAFKTAGPVAKSLGVEFKGLSATIGVLGNAGIKGTLAGTGLKRALTAIINASPKGRKALDVLGISSDDASKGFEHLTAKLEKARGELSDKVFTGKLFEAFGERAGPILAALVEQGSAAIGKLSKKIAGADGIAASIEKAKLDTLTGDVDKLKSAADGLAITLGKALARDARLAAQGLTKLLTVINEIAKFDNVGTRLADAQERAARKLDVRNRLEKKAIEIANKLTRAKRELVKLEAGRQLDPQGVTQAEMDRESILIGELAILREQRDEFGKIFKKTEAFRASGGIFSDKDGERLQKILDRIGKTEAVAKAVKAEAGGFSDEMKEAADAAKKVADELARAKEAMATGLAGSLLAPGRVSGGGGGGGGLGFGTSGELAGRQNVGFAPAPVGTTIAQRFRPENLPTETTDVEADAFREAMTRLREATAATALGMEIASSAFPELERTLADARGEVGKLAQVSEDAGGANADVVEAMRVNKASIENEIVARLKGIKGSGDFAHALARVSAEADSLGVSFDDIRSRVRAPVVAPDTGAADAFAGFLQGGGLNIDVGESLGKAIGSIAPSIGAAAGGPIGAAVGSAASGLITNIAGKIGDAIKPILSKIGGLLAADPMVSGSVKAFAESFVPITLALPLLAFAVNFAASAFSLLVPFFAGPMIVLGVVIGFASAALVVFGTSLLTFAAGIVLMPAIMGGLAAAFLFLLGETETFGRITAAIGGVVKAILLPQMELFAGKLVFLVGLFEMIAVVFRSLLVSFGDGDEVARFLFEVMQGIALAFLRTTSTALKFNNVLLTVAAGMLSAVSSFALGLAAALPAFDAGLNKLGVGANAAAEALSAMKVNTDVFDAAIDAFAVKEFEDATGRGNELIDASEELADSFKKLSDSSSNLPQFFRRAAIASGAEVPGLSGAPSIGGIQDGGQALQGMQITVAIDRVVTDNPLDLMTQIADIAEMQAFQSTGNPIKTAAGGTNGG